MGKKGGKSSGFVSQGLHKNVKQSTKRAVRRAYLDSPQRTLNQIKALQQGKDIVMTIANPNKEETNKRFIKVRVSGRDYLARQKHGYQMKGEAT